jgi:5-methylcytosine-specific restriction endonuclease McrA
MNSYRMAKARAALIKAHPFCRYCGSSQRSALTIDHLTPVSRGGGDARSNLTLACFRCNLAKGSMTEPEFLAWVKENGLPRMKDGWGIKTEGFVRRRKAQKKASSSHV